MESEDDYFDDVDGEFSVIGGVDDFSDELSGGAVGGAHGHGGEVVVWDGVVVWGEEWGPV